MTTHHPNHKSSQTLTHVQTPHTNCCGTTPCSSPTHDEIARRAYEIYIATGQKSGQCTQNWQQAEQSLLNQRQANHQAQQHGSRAFTPQLSATQDS